jgi:hypothetical protein
MKQHSKSWSNGYKQGVKDLRQIQEAKDVPQILINRFIKYSK